MLLSYSDNRNAPAERSDWPTRVLLAVIALGGTLAYAASFRALPAGAVAHPHHLAHAGACVGIAAGLSWPVFGGVLLLVTGARPSAMDWADACLRTMAAGVVVLAAAAAVNVDVRLLGAPAALGRWLPAMHLGFLVTGNATMCGVFVAEAKRLGLPAAAALGLWVLALNGTFVAILFDLYRNGVM